MDLYRLCCLTGNDSCRHERREEEDANSPPSPSPKPSFPGTNGRVIEFVSVESVHQPCFLQNERTKRKCTFQTRPDDDRCDVVCDGFRAGWRQLPKVRVSSSLLLSSIMKSHRRCTILQFFKFLTSRFASFSPRKLLQCDPQAPPFDEDPPDRPPLPPSQRR